MKKTIFIFSVIATLFSLTVNAQATSVATLNVNLYPIQTIVVNPTQTTVNLDYKTTTDYANGVNNDQGNHLTVYSTGAFTVTVNSSSDKLTSTTTDNINSSDITITPTLGTGNPLSTNILSTGVNLSTTAQEIISSDLGANNANFNINYSAKGSDAYINKYHKAQSPTVYTTKVIYTIAAK